MAELDTASIILLVLAVLIAPWVLQAFLRLFRGEKSAQEKQIELHDQTDL